MARTPSSKPIPGQGTPSKTPQSKNRPNLTLKNTHPSPNPVFAAKENPPTEHPVEVIGRIRDHPDRKEKPFSALQISSDGQTVRVRTDIGYRDFSLDGVSVSEDEDLDGFYKRFVESRIIGVKMGAKCTIMMYGPTGSGKSHTMFGCAKQPGIVYRALRDILGEGEEEDVEGDRRLGFGSFVQVTVLEIYNEEIYDLLSSNSGGGLGLGWPKGNASKVKLEVMGKKAKNATFISGYEAGKISREVAKVEKRRIIKSTLCNDRSSRSHCLIILDVPSVGGRLMLVDMAGSENIEQAGQTGFEAKMQTAKINQGNIALKRVVESIANGDCHVPFRDSKLTMLLQDSFEDDKSKILMILCASPDPKEMHKTISTLEYGAKAKCIVRATHTPVKGKINSEDSSSVILGSKIAAMDQFIFKLQMENKLKEKECDKAQKELSRKEEEVAELRTKLKLMEGRESLPNEEEINSKVNERTRELKLELEKKLHECQRMANELVELERRKMEEKIIQQQEEVEMLRRRLEEIESELCHSKRNHGETVLPDMDGSNFLKRLSEIYIDGDRGMEKSMDLDMDEQPIVHDVKEIGKDFHQTENLRNNLYQNFWTVDEGGDDDIAAPKYGEKVCLSTVFEREDEGEDEENTEDEEMEKIVVEEEKHLSSRISDRNSGIDINMGSFVGSRNLVHEPSYCGRDLEEDDFGRNRLEKPTSVGLTGELENTKESASARKTRIQNIFMLCGNHRELAQHVKIPTSAKKRPEATDIRPSPMKLTKEFDAEPNTKEMSQIQVAPQPELRLHNDIESLSSAPPEPFSSPRLDPSMSRRHISYETLQAQKENNRPINEETNESIEVYVKWEASKEYPGKFITKLKVLNDSSLADLRKLIEKCLNEDSSRHSFTFLMLGDPTGAPVVKEKEETIQASKLPICNNQLSVRLACLRPNKKVIQQPNHLPFSSLENNLPVGSNSPSMITQQVDDFSPKISQKFSSSLFLAGLQI
ncbi:P-loop containing nucleoside triphosphate hydrolases superfamily protein [Tasmannia lanceolata]|uniref:P-loop containing nucleoside triphosphate hydrolases superfamily protein n=1 Tax=Tasmannia lanceolata TaxID=3420 RepID=UPI0040639783